MPYGTSNVCTFRNNIEAPKAESDFIARMNVQFAERCESTTLQRTPAYLSSFGENSGKMIWFRHKKKWEMHIVKSVSDSGRTIYIDFPPVNNCVIMSRRILIAVTPRPDHEATSRPTPLPRPAPRPAPRHAPRPAPRRVQKPRPTPAPRQRPIRKRYREGADLYGCIWVEFFSHTHNSYFWGNGFEVTWQLPIGWTPPLNTIYN